jgi:hypothetical protein
MQTPQPRRSPRTGFTWTSHDTIVEGGNFRTNKTYTIKPSDGVPIVLRYLHNPSYLCFANTALQSLVWLSIEGPLRFIIERWQIIEQHAWLNTPTTFTTYGVDPSATSTTKATTATKAKATTIAETPTKATPTKAAESSAESSAESTQTTTPTKVLFRELFFQRHENPKIFQPTPSVIMEGLVALAHLSSSESNCTLQTDISLKSVPEEQYMEDAYIVFDWLYRCFVHMAGKFTVKLIVNCIYSLYLFII